MHHPEEQTEEGFEECARSSPILPSTPIDHGAVFLLETYVEQRRRLGRGDREECSPRWITPVSVC